MRALRLLPVAVLLPSLAFAQQPGGPTEVPDSVRRQITALEERIGRANFACDYRFFAEIEAPSSSSPTAGAA
jgi:hypothetical protein